MYIRVDGHLGGSYALAIASNAAVYMKIQISHPHDGFQFSQQHYWKDISLIVYSSLLLSKINWPYVYMGLFLDSVALSYLFLCQHGTILIIICM